MLLEAIRSADRRDWARARDYLRASLELEPIADISRALKRIEVAAHHPDAQAVKVDLRLYLGQVLELPDLPFLDGAPGMEELSDSATDIDELFPPSDAAAFVVSNPFSAEARIPGRESVTLVPGSLHDEDLMATLTPTLPPGGGAAQLAAQLAALKDSDQHAALEPGAAPTVVAPLDAAFADLAADLMNDPFGLDDLVPFPPPAEMPTLPVQPPTPDLLAAIAALHPGAPQVRVREREEQLTPPRGFASPASFGSDNADTLPPMELGSPLRFDNDATLPPVQQVMPQRPAAAAAATLSSRSAETPINAVPVIPSQPEMVPVHARPAWAQSEPSEFAATVPSIPVQPPEPTGPPDGEILVATPILFAAPSELRSASLAPKEMYFVSLMDGATVVEDLLDMSNMPRAEAFALIRRLLRDRIIRMEPG